MKRKRKKANRPDHSTVMAAQQMPEDKQYDHALRPKTFDDYIGQSTLVDKLKISTEAAMQRKEPMEHVLLHGPPGLGKTTLAYIIANHLGAKVHTTNGPAITKALDLVGILTNLEEHDILFIDEIHRLPSSIEEAIYPAMEDFRVDITVDEGLNARSIPMPLKPFTLIGATTRAGSISGPLRSRFGIVSRLEFYGPKDLFKILEANAHKLELEFEADALEEMARRARGTPRIANRLLRRVRDYAQVKGTGKLTRDATKEALRLEGIDKKGLDEQDREYLRTLIKIYRGGPAGLEALAATIGEDSETLADVVEPFLLQQAFVTRTPRGRQVTDKAYEHLKLTPSGRRY